MDLLGFSLGGFVAQVVAGRNPQLVRRIILAGTGPEGGEGIEHLPQIVAEGSRPLRRSRGYLSSSIGPRHGASFQYADAFVRDGLQFLRD